MLWKKYVLSRMCILVNYTQFEITPQTHFYIIFMCLYISEKRHVLNTTGCKILTCLLCIKVTYKTCLPTPFCSIKNRSAKQMQNEVKFTILYYFLTLQILYKKGLNRKINLHTDYKMEISRTSLLDWIVAITITNCNGLWLRNGLL